MINIHISKITFIEVGNVYLRNISKNIYMYTRGILYKYAANGYKHQRPWSIFVSIARIVWEV